VLDSGQKVAMSVKAGDKVLFGKYSGTEIKLNDKEYLIMSEGEILGILS
jgi:chaperonin GroES